ncbi:MAG: hypothetical protein ACERKZ_05795 [Lachnotalea sp.]
MAGVKAIDIPHIQQMYTDIWNLHKKYYIPEDNDLYWNNLTKEIDCIYKKYNTDICKAYLFALAEDIDKRFKERDLNE